MNWLQLLQQFSQFGALPTILPSVDKLYITGNGDPTPDTPPAQFYFDKQNNRLWTFVDGEWRPVIGGGSGGGDNVSDLSDVPAGFELQVGRTGLIVRESVHSVPVTIKVPNFSLFLCLFKVTLLNPSSLLQGNTIHYGLYCNNSTIYTSDNTTVYVDLILPTWNFNYYTSGVSPAFNLSSFYIQELDAIYEQLFLGFAFRLNDSSHLLGITQVYRYYPDSLQPFYYTTPAIVSRFWRHQALRWTSFGTIAPQKPSWMPFDTYVSLRHNYTIVLHRLL